MKEILSNSHGSGNDFSYLDRHMYKVGNLLIKSNQKCSCRTIRDLLDFLNKKYGSEKFSKKLHILTFRNIYKRLVSGYLDIYVFVNEYRDLVKNKLLVETFYDFVEELSTNGVTNFDKFTSIVTSLIVYWNGVYFMNQVISNYAIESYKKNWNY